MSVEAIAAVDGLVRPMAEISSAGTAKPVEGLYSWLSNQVQAADSDIRLADSAVRELAVGGTEDLHRTMLQLEKAKLSLSLVVQIRNRLLESYQEVMRMQV